jgi:hypothetical protein
MGDRVDFDRGTLRFLLGRGARPVVLNERPVASCVTSGSAVDLSRRLVGAARSGNFGESFRALTAGLHGVRPWALPTNSHRTAFLVNVYNGLVLDAVRAFAIRDSIRERAGFFHVAAYNISGRVLSLYQIEHGLLLGNRPIHPRLEPPFEADDERLSLAPTTVDPRVHFALNCATRSCPPIASYDEHHLDVQLDTATRAFVNSGEGLDFESEVLTLSSIFQMHESDFGGASHLVRWLAPYIDDSHARQRLLAGDFVFGEYDWTLSASLELDP